MKTIKRFAWGLLIICVFLSACSKKNSTDSFRVGLLIWSPYEIYYLAEQLGHYQDSGIEIVDYRSPSEAIRAYKNGALDAVALTNHLFLRLYQDDPDQRIVYLIDHSVGADALLARPQYPTIESLKGQRVAAESSTLGAYILYRALESGDLRPDEIVYVPADMANQLEGYKSGHFEAVTTYEPFRTQILDAGAVELFNSRSIPAEISDVLVSNQQTIAVKRKQIEAFIKGWEAALNEFRAKPLTSAARIVNREQLSPEEFIAALEGVELFGRQENRRLFSGPEPAYLLTLQDVAARMEKMGLIAKPEHLVRALDTSFIDLAGDQ